MPPDAETGSETPPAAGGLRRVLGPWDAACVVIGAIVGVGIFFTPSRVAALAGSPDMAVLAWIVGGGIALLGALTFAQLGVLYPHAGGQYEILRDAYGPLPAFLFVFCNATAIQGGAIAIIAIVCAQNLGVVAGREPLAGVPLLLVASLLIALVTAANVLGVRWGAAVQNLTVVAKVAALAAIILLGALAARSGASEPGTAAAAPETANGADATAGFASVAILFAAIVPSFFSYGGWQHALWIAGEVRDPRRNLPLAIIGGVVLVVVVYVLVSWAYLRLLGYAGVTGSAALAADAVGAVWPQGGRVLAAGAVALSAFGVLNAQLLSGPRLLYRLALDGRFFAAAGRVHRRFGTPAAAITLLSAFGLALLWLARARGADLLLTGVVFVDGIFFALTGAAVYSLPRRRECDILGPARWFVPALFVLGETAIVLGAYREPAVRGAALIGLAWIIIAVVCYGLFFRMSRTPEAG
ncbi:MAG: amino acid permease [Phycisphaerae bacterium]|jgi:APA family basic amino acid/polyamine antiporter